MDDLRDPTAAQSPFRLSPQELSGLTSHVALVYPEECCGFLLTGPEGESAFAPARNVSPTPRTAYEIHPTALNGVARQVERGWLVRAIYHSHTNGYPDLSDDDRRQAVGPGGRPLYPGATYLVLATGGPEEPALCVSGFRWDPETGEFREQPVEVPGLTE